MQHVYEHASEPKAVWHVPEASHGQIPEVRPGEYEIVVITFFDNAFDGNCTH